MSIDNPEEQPLETPLERAARLENQPPVPESVELVDDIDQFVARTDPEHLPEAEAELAAWKTPEDPLSHNAGAGPSETGNVVGVFSAYNEVEANIVKGVLDAAGIPSSFDNRGGTVMGGIFSAGEQVWADIVVPESYADAAREAIAEATQHNSGDDQDTEELTPSDAV